MSESPTRPAEASRKENNLKLTSCLTSAMFTSRFWKKSKGVGGAEGAMFSISNWNRFVVCGMIIQHESDYEHTRTSVELTIHTVSHKFQPLTRTCPEIRESLPDFG